MESYLKVIAQRTNRLPLAPFDPKGRDAEAISLGQVFINLDAGLKQQRAPDGAGQIRYRRFRAALGAIHQHERLILLGDPGSGKSTLLRYLSHCLAQHALQPEHEWLAALKWSVEEMRSTRENEEQAWQEAEKKQQQAENEQDKPIQVAERHWTAKAPIPILVELRDFARTEFKPHSPLALWEFAAERLRQDGFGADIPALEQLARSGDLFFLLDGVDEVPLGQRADIWRAVQALADGPYLENRWLATCRVLSFVPQEAPTGVPVQTLQPLRENQIDRFIESWYGGLAQTGELGSEQAENMSRQLQQAARRRQLQPLAQNPMLLTIMALVQTYHGSLPDERARLYQACVETLLLRWQRHKEQASEQELPDFLAQLGVSQQQLERLLWEIAWKAHSQAADREESADIAEVEVMQIASQHLGGYDKAQQFVNYTERRAHLLVGVGGVHERVYKFPHRTFQEYLAACYIASQRDFSRGAPLIARRGDTWREVLNLATGTLVFNQNNVEKALDSIREVLPPRLPKAGQTKEWYRVWLAGEMMVVVGADVARQDNVGRQVLPKLCQMLAALLAQGQLTPPQRAEAGDALGLLGDPRPGVCTLEPEMIPIAAGPFLMHEAKYEVQVEAYAIARYPVTNAQFRFFVEGSGYDDETFWTEDGWALRQKEKWEQPRFWDDAFISIENKPVVGVSWYEAVAYCHWLSVQTGKKYRLPTEAEWERAARHTDGREYPWGDDWQDGIINSDKAGIGRTTAVASFPLGAAECGAQDMSGNVWEWCHTKYVSEEPYRGDDGREALNGPETRCLRGGAFNDLNWGCRAAYRNSYDPYGRGDDIGFRVVEHLSDSVF